MKYINLTHHAITEAITGTKIQPSGTVARVQSPSTYAGDIAEDGIPTFKDNPNAVVLGLPEPKEGILYIVSSLVLGFTPDRVDVVAPGAPKRCDKTNEIVGCKGFRVE